MKNFKPGQPVVFSLEKCAKEKRYTISELRLFFISRGLVLPAEKEVVTITRHHSGKFWCIAEYPKSLLSVSQAFDENALFPLEEISKEETEKITAELEKVFDPELFPEFV